MRLKLQQMIFVTKTINVQSLEWARHKRKELFEVLANRNRGTKFKMFHWCFKYKLHKYYSHMDASLSLRFKYNFLNSSKIFVWDVIEKFVPPLFHLVFVSDIKEKRPMKNWIISILHEYTRTYYLPQD